jgi:protein-tyrosine phosphatase
MHELPEVSPATQRRNPACIATMHNQIDRTFVDSSSDLSTPANPSQRVLFICTGNFYRSRFAEAIFNYHAEKQGIPWKAFSRGLAVHLAEGYLSTFTAEALKTRQIDLRHTGPGRIQLSEQDLVESKIRIALDRREHFGMMVNEFPTWADQIDYWDISDMPYRSSTDALPEIEFKVIQLLEKVSP